MSESLKNEAVEVLQNAKPNYLCNILPNPKFTLKELAEIDEVLTY